MSTAPGNGRSEAAENLDRFLEGTDNEWLHIMAVLSSIAPVAGDRFKFWLRRLLSLEYIVLPFYTSIGNVTTKPRKISLILISMQSRQLLFAVSLIFDLHCSSWRFCEGCLIHTLRPGLSGI